MGVAPSFPSLVSDVKSAHLDITGGHKCNNLACPNFMGTKLWIIRKEGIYCSYPCADYCEPETGDFCPNSFLQRINIGMSWLNTTLPLPGRSYYVAVRQLAEELIAAVLMPTASVVLFFGTDSWSPRQGMLELYGKEIIYPAQLSVCQAGFLPTDIHLYGADYANLITPWLDQIIRPFNEDALFPNSVYVPLGALRKLDINDHSFKEE